MKKHVFFRLPAGCLVLAACGQSPPSPQSPPSVQTVQPSTAAVAPERTESTGGTAAPPGPSLPLPPRRQVAGLAATRWEKPPVPPADPNVIILPASVVARRLSPRQKAVELAAHGVAIAFEAQQKKAQAAHAEALAAWHGEQARLQAQQRRLEAAILAMDGDTPPPGRLASLAALEEIRRKKRKPEPFPADGEPEACRKCDDLIFQFRQAYAQNDAEKIAALSADFQALAPGISQALYAQYQAEVAHCLQQETFPQEGPPEDGPPEVDAANPPR